MFSAALFVFSGALALIGWTAATGGFVLMLQNRRRRSHYKDKEAAELMLCGAAITAMSALLALSAL